MTDRREDDDPKQLYDRASRGDHGALTVLLESYLPQLRSYVRVHMGKDLQPRLSVDDVVQSVCKELCEAETTFEFSDEDRFRGWLFAATLNKIREKGRFHRRQKRDVGRERVAAGSEDDRLPQQSSPSARSPSRQAVAREDAERFEAALATLSEDHREVIKLARIEQLPHDVIAELMGRSVGAVRQLLGRALYQLKAKLDEGAE